MRDGMEVWDKAAMSAETDRTIMSTYNCAHELAGAISQPFQNIQELAHFETEDRSIILSEKLWNIVVKKDIDRVLSRREGQCGLFDFPLVVVSVCETQRSQWFSLCATTGWLPLCGPLL